MTDDNAKRDLIYPCDCGDDHFLRISWWPADPRCGFDVDAYFHVGGYFCRSLRKRVKTAWKVLTGDHADTYVGLALNADTARELEATMKAVADEWDKEKVLAREAYDRKIAGGDGGAGDLVVPGS